MSKDELHNKAIELRKKGWTYSQIKHKLNVSRGTLSRWLGNIMISKLELENLTNNIRKRRLIAAEKTKITKRKQKKKHLEKIYSQESQRLLPLSKREKYIAGLFLYWGEGKKGSGTISLGNTDVGTLKFFEDWLTSCLNILPKDIRVALHLYSDMDVNKEFVYWNKKLSFPREQFYKPYIKKNQKKFINHNGYGHGTCYLIVNDIEVKRKIMMGIKVIRDNYCDKNSKFII